MTALPQTAGVRQSANNHLTADGFPLWPHSSMALQHLLTRQQHAPTCSSRADSCQQACPCPQTQQCTNQQLHPPTLSLGLCAHIPLHKLYSRNQAPTLSCHLIPPPVSATPPAVLWFHRCHCSCSIPVSPLLLTPRPRPHTNPCGGASATASAAQHARLPPHLARTSLQAHTPPKPWNSSPTAPAAAACPHHSCCCCSQPHQRPLLLLLTCPGT